MENLPTFCTWWLLLSDPDMHPPEKVYIERRILGFYQYQIIQLKINFN